MHHAGRIYIGTAIPRVLLSCVNSPSMVQIHDGAQSSDSGSVAYSRFPHQRTCSYASSWLE